ncbi:hypothetical protein ESM27_23380, partial [Shigella sonnei]|nr:hypothetical protein [Shigella sonnei]
SLPFHLYLINFCSCSTGRISCILCILYITGTKISFNISIFIIATECFSTSHTTISCIYLS